MNEATDARIKILLEGSRSKPCTGLYETGNAWGLETSSIEISKRYATFRAGFGWHLAPSSHFYKRAFDYPDLGKRGWVIIFQVHPPDEPGHKPAEYVCAWVQPEQERDADQWIDFLNSEIRDRLRATPEARP